MLRHGIPADVVTALRAVSASFRAWGSRRRGHRAAARRRGAASCATARCACCTAPATAPPTRCFHDERRSLLLAADHLIKHISSNPLIARPLERARATSPGPARRRWSTTSPRCSARARWICRWCCRGHGEPIADHAALIDERLRMHERPRREDPRPDRRAAAHRARDRARAVGQRRRHPGLPDALRGARPRRSAAARRARGRTESDGIARFEAA